MKKGNPWALLPLGIFLLLFIGTALITKDFSKMPVIVAFVIAGAVALSMNWKEKFSSKVDVFTKGAGHPNIILMCIIFILAGAFSSVASGMGAVESTVNLGLSFLPANYLIVGLFVIGCFISISMGTSMGTVVALAPIGIGIATQTDISLPLAMGAVIGGAMFGDNLSMISDTTIAAVRTQGTKMSDKFKANFIIVLPAAIITAIILGVITVNASANLPDDLSYNVVKVLPYLAVLIVALLGVNVLLVLVGGIIFAGIIGIVDGSFGFYEFLGLAGEGIMGMEDLAMIAILIGGIVAIIQHNGGIDYLLYTITSKIKSRKGAEFGIAGLVSVADVSTANNTISIIMTGPLAKNIAEEYDIDPRKSASILDIFSCAFQGMVPYGGQLLAAAGLATISPIAIMPYSIYPMLILIFGILAIIFNFPRLTTNRMKEEKSVVS